MRKQTTSKVAVKRAITRSTKDSAALERRVVPASYVRSEKTERFLAERRQRA